jgi:hypothetical protein
MIKFIQLPPLIGDTPKEPGGVSVKWYAILKSLGTPARERVKIYLITYLY